MEDLHICVQVLCVFTSASNPNSFYGLKIRGYIDFSWECRVIKHATFGNIFVHYEDR